MIRVHFDFETFSECDLRKAGAWAYATHPSTRVLCMGYAYDNETPQLWLPGDDLPDFMRDDCIGDYELHAWNSFFEWVIWEHAMGVPRCYTPPLEYWHDTAALASAMSLPRALGNCGKALGMPASAAKDKRGYDLIKLLSIPNKKNGDPKLLKEMYEYCLQDVVAERAIAKKLYSLNPIEREVWKLDQKINIRGIAVDVERVDDALEVYDKTYEDTKARLTNITRLGNPNSQKQFLDWMVDQGHIINDITKATLSNILDQEDTQGTHEAIRLRMKLAKTAPKKYHSMRTRVGGGTRLHGNIMYHGASTGRWASTGVNLQNIARPTVEPDLCIPLLSMRDLDVFHMNDIDPMEALSSSVRGMLVPSDGKKFIIGDYASIESRALAWLAGQEDKLEIYRGHGKLYEYVASNIYKKPIEEITKAERFVGKIGELACIAEDELVLTDTGLVPIQEVTTCMRLWDGIEWVEHQGLIYKGEQDVITYQNLTATPSHKVFTLEHGTTSMAHAAESGAHIIQSGAGREAIRVGESPHCGEEIHEQTMANTASLMSMPRLRKSQMDKYKRPCKEKKQRMSEVFTTKANSPLARQEAYTSQTEMHEPERPTLEELWGAGYKIQLPIRNRRWIMDNSEHRSSRERPQHPDRQNRQQRRLLCRELKMGHSGGKQSEHSTILDHTLEGYESNPVPRYSCIPTSIPTRELCRHNFKSADSEGRVRRNPSEVAEYKVMQTKRRVWDILEAGQRNRFTVSDKLVHNCGYGGGAGALQGMAEVYKAPLDKKAAEKIKQQWRAVNPNITAFWPQIEQAAREAVQKKKMRQIRGIKFAYAHNFLVCQLPSGRRLYYYRPQIVNKKVLMFKTEETDDSPSMSYVYSPFEYANIQDFLDLAKKFGVEPYEFIAMNIEFWGVNSQTKKWCLQSTYGGKLCLAGDTKVLTPRGWVRIDRMEITDKVWDGYNWVEYRGRLDKGTSDTMELDGLRMTKNHEILTDAGWKSASSSEGYRWEQVELPNNDITRFVRVNEKITIQEGRRQEQVYDLMDTGPHNQFTVLGKGGPRLVHNCENITQAVARDLMAESMLSLEAKGYNIVLTVHDEIISEVGIDDKTKSVEDFTRIMEKTPRWAEGLPVAVEAYEATRYRK